MQLSGVTRSLDARYAVWLMFLVIILFPWEMRNIGAELACACFLAMQMAIYRLSSARAWRLPACILILGLASTWASIAYGAEINFWQLLREVGPLVFFLAAFDLGQQASRSGDADRYYTLLNMLLLGTTVHAILAYFGVSVANARIVIEPSASGDGYGRVYSVLVLSYFPMLFYMLKKHTLLIAAFCVAGIALTASRGYAVTAILIATHCAALSMSRHEGKYILSWLTLRRVALISVVVFIGVSGLWFLSDRLYATLGAADSPRIREMHDAISMLSSNAYRVFFGIGFGIPYTMGWFTYSDVTLDVIRSYENSQFDIHNSFFAVFLRVGVVGICMFLLALLRTVGMVKQKVPIILFLVGSGFTSHALVQTFDGALALYVWGFMEERRRKETSLVEQKVY
ncbi:MAG: hypothetical protein P9C36_15665 [Defluviicoccus sp.]|nr:hypothetical protein [Defluviicoccus sp.]MDG4594057.1 hypothetical protein [Defluviicoccus sp.]